MRISLVSYTYNDFEFISTLLSDSHSWGIDFFETIIVDDCSATPFETTRSDVRLIHNNSNQGPAKTKQIGLGAASGDIIFSIDCDIRPHKKWAFHALSYLQHQEIGAVGTYPIYPRPGSSKVSQWQCKVNKFNKNQDELCKFIMGGIFLLRRDVYQAIGGIRCDSCDIAEDIRMSKDITNKGYQLVNIRQYPVYQIRPLSISQLCKQNIVYGGESQVYLAYNEGLEQVISKQLQTIRNNTATAILRQPSLHIFSLFVGVSLLFFVKERLKTLGIPTNILDNVLTAFVGLLSKNSYILNAFIKILISLGLENTFAAILDDSPHLNQNMPAMLSEQTENLLAFFDGIVCNARLNDLEEETPRGFHYLDDKPITHGIDFLK